MKKNTFIPAVCLAVAMLIFFGSMLTDYARPMADVSLDLTISMPDDVMEIDPAAFDSKGWTVYTQEGDVRTELEPDGFGSFLGIELGQTFYLSRVLEEELDSPTLQIHTAETSHSVWLDDALIYADHPELDNRIGRLTLPMMGWARMEPITISLPPDYQGKTLTIAQSFPDYAETPTMRAIPAGVQLYCGYAYESRLISESFLLAIISTAAFLTGALMLAAFVLHRDASLLCVALVAFLWMVQQLQGASFFWKYYNIYGNTLDSFIYMASGLALLVFLALRAEKWKKVLWSIVAVCGVSCAAQFAYLWLVHSSTPGSAALAVFGHLPYWIMFAGLVAAWLIGLLVQRRDSEFYRMFVPAAAIAAAVYAVQLYFSEGAVYLLAQLQEIFISGQGIFLYHKTLPPFIFAALLSAAIETIRREINRRTERRLLKDRYEMTQASYENMRLQHEEIAMLRHDMVKHYRTLLGISGEAQRTAYLTELLGQNEKIRPVLGSGNEIIDIIIGSSMRSAADAGVSFEIVRSDAAEKLPLSDADLCSLIMNLMDNAVHAAARSGARTPCIRLDLHMKNDFFVFTCRNSANLETIEGVSRKETAPKRGLGLKIVNQIAEKNGILIETEYGADYYEVTLLVPPVRP